MPAPSFASQFGSLIRRRRRELDITQASLAAALDISQPSVSSWEHGDSVPTAQALLGLLRILELDIAQVIALLDDNGEEAA